jgi:hypothetical protein
MPKKQILKAEPFTGHPGSIPGPGVIPIGSLSKKLIRELLVSKL